MKRKKKTLVFDPFIENRRELGETLSGHLVVHDGASCDDGFGNPFIGNHEGFLGRNVGRVRVRDVSAPLPFQITLAHRLRSKVR